MLRRLGRGEYTAVAGVVGLLATMLLDWFETSPSTPFAAAQRSGWTDVGWLAVLLTFLAIVATAFWLFALLAPDTPSLPFAPDEITLGAGVAAAIALGVGLADAHHEVLPIAFAGPACAALVALGAWRSISDDVSGASP